ncbi:MAG: 50S ribosomal protein L3 [Planctomycetes bacterium]|nr:50S ribosomal protein L3 [Planctomycetota bacterium]
MTSYILGRKRGMTQLFTKGGDVVPVTVIEAGPCVVTQVRTLDLDGYSAVQIGLGAAKEKHINKPQRAFFKKIGVEPIRVLREQRLASGEAAPAVGAKVTVESFQVGMLVDVTGTMKGRGFAGTVKRHGFTTGAKTHGGMSYRRPGSIGAAADPAKGVQKGRRMCGHYGDSRFTQKNLVLVAIDAERHLLFVRGAVPGYNGALVHVRTAKTGQPLSADKIPALALSFGASAEKGE